MNIPYTHPFYAEEQADKVLEDWDDICNELGIVHCLVFGNCLGMVREGGYIETHSDMDVYVRDEDPSQLSKKLIEHGFVPGQNYTESPYLGAGQHFYRDEILLDISFELPDDEEFLEAFDEVTYKERKYSVPHPIEEYLEHKYGNWRMPQ